MNTPKTLLEAVRYFSDLDRCEDYIRAHLLESMTHTPDA